MANGFRMGSSQQSNNETGRRTPARIQHAARLGLAPGRYGAPLVLLLSPDPLLRLAVERNCEPPWDVETQESVDSVWEFVSNHNVGLVVLDDQLLPVGEREWFLNRLHRIARESPVLYMASSHSPEVERSARSKGVAYYTSKPCEAASLGQVLRTWLKHLRERGNRIALHA